MGEIIINTSGEYTNPATEGAVRNIASAVALPSTVLAYGQVSALAGSETQITSITSAKGIWVFAPLNADGTSANSYTVYVGPSGFSASNVNKGKSVKNTDGDGFFVAVSNPSILYVRGSVSATTDKLNYWVVE